MSESAKKGNNETRLLGGERMLDKRENVGWWKEVGGSRVGGSGMGGGRKWGGWKWGGWKWGGLWKGVRCAVGESKADLMDFE